jgi:hypothetical protein
MTSVLRSPSQIGVRVKYLIAFKDLSGGGESGVGADGVAAFTLPAGSFSDVTSIALAADVSGAADYAEYAVTAGTLFRDMGRSITVVDADGNHIALYRNVQLVSGSTTEGVDPTNSAYSANIYVRVWADDGDNIAVARLG